MKSLMILALTFSALSGFAQTRVGPSQNLNKLNVKSISTDILGGSYMYKVTAVVQFPNGCDASLVEEVFYNVDETERSLKVSLFAKTKRAMCPAVYRPVRKSYVLEVSNDNSLPISVNGVLIN